MDVIAESVAHAYDFAVVQSPACFILFFGSLAASAIYLRYINEDGLVRTVTRTLLLSVALLHISILLALYFKGAEFLASDIVHTDWPEVIVGIFSSKA